MPNWRIVAPDDVLRWQDQYDASDIEFKDVDLGGIPWLRCYTSDLPRAVQTAEQIYSGTIVQWKELREVRLSPIKSRFPMPFFLWSTVLRIAILFNHQSQLDRKRIVEERVRKLLDRIVAEMKSTDNILIVSHGALMYVMRRELRRRGFHGPTFQTPENGKLYVFEKA